MCSESPYAVKPSSMAFCTTSSSLPLAWRQNCPECEWKEIIMRWLIESKAEARRKELEGSGIMTCFTSSEIRLRSRHVTGTCLCGNVHLLERALASRTLRFSVISKLHQLPRCRTTFGLLEILYNRTQYEHPPSARAFQNSSNMVRTAYQS